MFEFYSVNIQFENYKCSHYLKFWVIVERFNAEMDNFAKPLTIYDKIKLESCDSAKELHQWATSRQLLSHPRVLEKLSCLNAKVSLFDLVKYSSKSLCISIQVKYPSH